MSQSFPLSGLTALITGVSRRRGIGFAIAQKLATMGANIVIQHYVPHDMHQPWGADSLDALLEELEQSLHPDALLYDISADLSDDNAAEEVIHDALAVNGSLDILICNHAKSGGDGSIIDMNADRLDAFWKVNTRSTLLLTTAFARTIAAVDESASRRPGEAISFQGPYSNPRGKVIWMTSGQLHGPMPGEVAYAASKAALAGVTATVASELLQLGIVLNTVNPGPVNTGYMDPETTDRSLADIESYIAPTPFGRVGAPSDPANLIGWLCTEEASWIVGQVLTSDGGFSLQ